MNTNKKMLVALVLLVLSVGVAVNAERHTTSTPSSSNESTTSTPSAPSSSNESTTSTPATPSSSNESTTSTPATPSSSESATSTPSSSGSVTSTARAGRGTLPDLKVNSFRTACNGDGSIAYRYQISNSGRASTGDVVLHFVVRAYDRDNKVGEQRILYYNSPLNVNASIGNSTYDPLTSTTSTPSDWSAVEFFIDPDNAIAELSEVNNRKFVRNPCTPDLRVDRLSSSCRSLAPLITYEIKNIGTSTSTATSNKLSAYQNRTIVWENEWLSPVLAPGAASSTIISLSSTTSTRRAWSEVQVAADWRSLVLESRENNNEKRARLNCR